MLKASKLTIEGQNTLKMLFDVRIKSKLINKKIEPGHEEYAAPNHNITAETVFEI